MRSREVGGGGWYRLRMRRGRGVCVGSGLRSSSSVRAVLAIVPGFAMCLGH
uniref:RNA helicase n=1 Tax=Parascaris univalens TaxID=6257 RepID=A0A915B7V4_PARUN